MRSSRVESAVLHRLKKSVASQVDSYRRSATPALPPPQTLHIEQATAQRAKLLRNSASALTASTNTPSRTAICSASIALLVVEVVHCVVFITEEFKLTSSLFKPPNLLARRLVRGT